MGWWVLRIADRYTFWKAAAHLNKLITTTVTAAAEAVGLNALYSISFFFFFQMNMHDIVYRQANEMHVAKFLPSLRLSQKTVTFGFATFLISNICTKRKMRYRLAVMLATHRTWFSFKICFYEIFIFQIDTFVGTTVFKISNYDRTT